MVNADSNVARSPDWLRASFLSESDQLNTFGPEETAGIH